MQDDVVEIRLPHSHEPIEVDRRRYEIIREALMKAIPDDEEGLPRRVLTEAVMPYVRPRDFDGAELQRWITDVRLDLEARGVLETCVEKGPPHVRRRRSEGPADARRPC